MSRLLETIPLTFSSKNEIQEGVGTVFSTGSVCLYLYLVDSNEHAVDAPHIRHYSGTDYLVET